MINVCVQVIGGQPKVIQVENGTTLEAALIAANVPFEGYSITLDGDQGAELETELDSNVFITLTKQVKGAVKTTKKMAKPTKKTAKPTKATKAQKTIAAVKKSR